MLYETTIKLTQTVTDGKVRTESTIIGGQTLYTLEELESEAREVAMDEVRERFCDHWVDEVMLADAIREAWAFALAEDGAGQGSRPDLEDMVTGWDIHTSSIDIVGTLTPDNAPKLPWPDFIPSIDWERNGYWVDGRDPENQEEAEAYTNLVLAMEAARDSAIEAGESELEYRYSNEGVAEMIEANPMLFDEHGNYVRFA